MRANRASGKPKRPELENQTYNAAPLAAFAGVIFATALFITANFLRGDGELHTLILADLSPNVKEGPAALPKFPRTPLVPTRSVVGARQRKAVAKLALDAQEAMADRYSRGYTKEESNSHPQMLPRATLKKDKRLDALLAQAEKLQARVARRKEGAMRAQESASLSRNTLPGHGRFNNQNTFDHLDECPDADHAIYWKHIPKDHEFVPKDNVPPNLKQAQRYLSYEFDEGGWNNMRMGMEMFMLIAYATGRILVLPPDRHLYLLSENWMKLGFSDFIDTARARKQIKIMSSREFLLKEGMTGGLKNGIKPGSKGEKLGEDNYNEWKAYMREASFYVDWTPDKNVLALGKDWRTPAGNAVPERLKEMRKFAQGRRVIELLTDPSVVNAKNLHFLTDMRKQIRWLSHYYTVLWWADKSQELYYKRFVRDAMHYRNEVFCTAGPIVKRLKEMAGVGGTFSTYHIRRGDFQFELTRVPAQTIFDRTKELLKPGELLYIATDEKDKSFFQPFRDAGHRVVFLDDFCDKKCISALKNPNWIGMIEQVVMARGRVFIGTWWSTFTGYSQRIRGYLGEEKNSYYSFPEYKYAMQDFSLNGLHGGGWWREWPLAWAGIDADIDK